MIVSMEAVAPDCIVSRTGGQYFREIGGYPAADGRHLRCKLLWRSAKLDELTDEDVKVIRALGIATNTDLRHRSERRHSPTHETLVTNARVLTWDGPIRQGQPRESLFYEGADPAAYVDAVRDLYRLFPESHVKHLCGLYHAIANRGTANLIRCADGKDRTGVAVARSRARRRRSPLRAKALLDHVFAAISPRIGNDD